MTRGTGTCVCGWFKFSLNGALFYNMFFAAGVKLLESDIITINIIIIPMFHSHTHCDRADILVRTLQIVTHFEQICVLSSDWHGVIIALNKYYFNSTANTKWWWPQILHKVLKSRTRTGKGEPQLQVNLLNNPPLILTINLHNSTPSLSPK